MTMEVKIVYGNGIVNGNGNENCKWKWNCT